MDEFVKTFSPTISTASLEGLKRKGIIIKRAGRYETSVVTEYFQNGLAQGQSYRIDKVWKIERPNEENRFVANGYAGDRSMLLWHGTASQNIVSILENGFSTSAAHGGLFGSGIYFADRTAKSLVYCRGNKSLFLCQVALGSMYRQNRSNSFRSPPVENGITFHSVKGVGQWEPDPNIRKRLDGANVLVGPTVKNTRIDAAFPTSLMYNEFIVYDDSRVVIRYLVSFI